MAARWRFVLTDRFYTPVGEVLNAYNRRVAQPISKLDSASFRVRLDNPLAQEFMRADGYIKAYRDDRLMFFGPIISAEESVEDSNPSVAVNCVGAGWILLKRLAGRSAQGTVFGLTDRAQIVKQLIDVTNTESIAGLPFGAAETGISTAGPIAAGSATSYTAGPYKPIMEIMTELSGAYDGFEWRFRPLENFNPRSQTGRLVEPKIAQFEAAPRPFGFGQERPDAIFEWGVGRNNIKGYKRVVSRDGQANRQFHSTSSGPDVPGFPTLSALDLGSISSYKLLEELVQVDLTTAALRQQYLDESVRVRRNPRQVIEFTPHIDPGHSGRVPRFGVDFEVGDIVTARAVFGGRVMFDARFRLWGLTFEINDLGVETGSTTLAEEA